MGVLVIVLLLFAIGASGQRLDQQQILEPKSELDNLINTAIKVSPEISGAELNTRIQQIIAKEQLPENMHWSLLKWAIEQERPESYTTEQIKEAYHIYQNTPLAFESALYLTYYCEVYGVDSALVLSIIEVESRFDQHAVGKSRDRGYMQIIPSTERWLANTFGEELGLTYDPQQIFDPEYNLGLAIRYIAELEKKYGDNAHRVLSEYNRGTSKLATYYQTHRTYQTSYSRSILSRVHKYSFND